MYVCKKVIFLDLYKNILTHTHAVSFANVVRVFITILLQKWGAGVEKKTHSTGKVSAIWSGYAVEEKKNTLHTHTHFLTCKLTHIYTYAY